MAELLRVCLVTRGDPRQTTGGYLYHQRLAEAAVDHGAEVRFASVTFLGADAAVAAVRDRDEVLVLDSIVAATMAGALLRTRTDPVVVGSLHQPPGGMDGAAWRRSIVARFDRLAYARARLLVVASDALAVEVAAAGVPADKLRVVPPGRDLPPVDQADGPVPGLRQGRSMAVLCVGNWLPRKGILALLEAVARLPQGSVTLHLVGERDVAPDYGRRVAERLAQPDLAGRVVAHGTMPRARLAAYFAAADCFALSSTREPFGTVYAEAMGVGLPVVGWAAGNLPHLADDGVEGRVVPTGDVAALSTALRELAADGVLRRRLGEAARRRAASLPTWSETAARFFAVVREAVASG